MSFIVITPVKNEESYFHFIANSMISQELKPLKWIIVDDSSIDNSANLILAYARKYDWIGSYRFENIGEPRSYGAKVIRAFNFGLEKILDEKYNFLVKLDADLTLPQDYFKEIEHAFNKDPKLGVVGGIIVENKYDFSKKISKIDFVEGAIKSIRKECFEDIGGFWEINGWDGIDQHMARYHGWEIKNLAIPVTHHQA